VNSTFNYWLEFIQDNAQSSVASKLHIQDEKIDTLTTENSIFKTKIDGMEVYVQELEANIAKFIYEENPDNVTASGSPTNASGPHSIGFTGDDSRLPPLPDNQDSYYPCKRAMLQEQPSVECFPSENCLGCDHSCQRTRTC